MAKIHIRGGSPLRLRFDDNTGKDLEVELVRKAGGGYEYEVEDVSTKQLLDSKPGAGNYVFRTSGPDKKTVVLDYKS